MSTIKSDSANLTLNCDGASSSLKIQIDGVEKSSISSAGAFTSTTIDATKLTGNLPAISGANLTGIVSIPAGVIVMWSGAANAIPAGWNLCDGNNSTPNLVGTFIKAGSTAGTTGGSTTTGAHTLSSGEMPSHRHVLMFSSTTGSNFQRPLGPRGGNDEGPSSNAMNLTGGGGSHTHPSTEPPYYELCYIMKS